MAVLGASSLADTLITTREGLEAIATDAETLAGSYALGADIDLGDADWTPIGTDSAPFTGTLHGNGHAIRNLVCTNNPSGNSCRGLFGCASNATIKCVSVSGTVAGKQYVGGLVGRARGETIISNCSAAVEVTATGSYAGGLVGSCDGGNATNWFTDCRADGFVGGNGFVGGFIGYVYAPAMISNCVARGDVRSAGSDYGGFVGRLAHDSATIDNCWSSGAVWGTGGNIGSFVGNRGSGTITNCAASAYANGLRLFCGSSTAITGGSLSQAEVKARSADWPSAPKRSKSSAVIQISTAEELLAVTNNLAGCYVLMADIDLEGATIEPIGNYNAAFTGEFYGQNHKISGFSVNTMNRYAGLFGKIAGGRVSGVQAEGDVTGSYEGSGSDVGVGGFAGKIDSKSLVDGCKFDGWVVNTATYNAGGFVGYTADSPAILRCCVHVSVENGSGQPNTGGFIGNHGGGSIMDCYAEAEVEAGGSYVGGFAGFVASSARIATSWCSGQVDATDTYRGAFVGQANGRGLVTNSYYDTSANGQMEASGTSSPRGSAAYAGVTPLDADDMTDKANFPAFDFTDTWIITEADGAPTLRTFFSAYDLWLKDAGIAYEPEPNELVNGIPAGARYVFGIDPQIGPANLAEPLIDIKFDTDGKPYVKLPAQANTEGATVTVLATEDLSDWSNAAEYPVDPVTGICLPDLGNPIPDHMFFKYRIDIR